MITHAFLEFEAYASAVGDADLTMVLPRLHKPRWEISEFHVDQLHLQFGSEWSGNIAEGVTRPDGQILFIPLHGQHHANGVPLDEHSVFVMNASSEFTISVQDPHDWCSVFLPSGPDSSAPADRSTCVVELPEQTLANIRLLLTQLHDSIQSNPSILTETASRRAVKQDLIGMCQRIRSAGQPPATSTGRPPLRRSEVIHGLREMIASHPHECLAIEDLTSALDISERSLRNVFLEYYGMPPRRFLMTRRLNQVRNVLKASDPEQTTVTAVAARFGFWHFGRFAGAYQKVFQESPSTTLYGSGQLC